jgi:hypothetical protein
MQTHKRGQLIGKDMMLGSVNHSVTVWDDG